MLLLLLSAPSARDSAAVGDERLVRSRSATRLTLTDPSELKSNLWIPEPMLVGKGGRPWGVPSLDEGWVAGKAVVDTAPRMAVKGR